MKSLLEKRLPGILAVGLVALAVGAAGAPASASDATVSGLTASQKTAKAKAIKKCKRIKKASKRKTCIRSVNRKYNRLAAVPPAGTNYRVDVIDNDFDPKTMNLKVNDSITWDWAKVGGFEPHNVTLTTGPAGIARNQFTSETTADRTATFSRSFPVAGKYDFVCTLHFTMTMSVQVSN